MTANPDPQPSPQEGTTMYTSATYGMDRWITALQQADSEATAQGFTKGTPEWNDYFDRRWQEILRQEPATHDR